MFRICLYRLATPTKRDRLNFAYATDEERAASIEKAEKLEASLGSDYPALVRTMLPSHVSGGFWLVSYYSIISLFFVLKVG